MHRSQAISPKVFTECSVVGHDAAWEVCFEADDDSCQSMKHKVCRWGLGELPIDDLV